MGRGIPKLVSLFGDIRDIIDDADQHGLRLQGDLDDTELDDLDEAEAVMKKQQFVFALSLKIADYIISNRQARSFRAFKVLNHLIPNFLTTIDNSDSETLSLFYAQVMLMYLS
jgi:hypothetical protein